MTGGGRPYPAPGLPNEGTGPFMLGEWPVLPTGGAILFSMWFTPRRLIALLVKLALATLKLDDQPAHLLRQPAFLRWELLPEYVSKNLDRRVLHHQQRGAVRRVPDATNRAGADPGRPAPDRRTARRH